MKCIRVMVQAALYPFCPHFYVSMFQCFNVSVFLYNCRAMEYGGKGGVSRRGVAWKRVREGRRGKAKRDRVWVGKPRKAVAG